jgi:hypothetical protein
MLSELIIIISAPFAEMRPGSATMRPGRREAAQPRLFGVERR